MKCRLRYVAVCFSYYESHTAQKIVEKIVEKRVEVPVERIKYVPASQPKTTSVGSQTLKDQGNLGVQTDNPNDSTPRVKTIHVYHEQEHPASPSSKPKTGLANPDQASEHNVEHVSTVLSDKHNSMSRRGSRDVKDIARRASASSAKGGHIDIISRTSSGMQYGGMAPPRPTSPPPPEFIQRATNRGSQTISAGSKGRPALKKHMSTVSFHSAVGSQHNSRSGTPISSLSSSYRSATPGTASTHSYRKKKNESVGTVSNIERRSYSLSSSSAHFSEPKSANEHLDEDDESDEDSISMTDSHVIGNAQPDPIIQAITQTMIGECGYVILLPD